MNESKMIQTQVGIQRNLAELDDFLSDMNRWETKMKSSDDGLRGVTEEIRLPPVRNAQPPRPTTKTAKIGGYDYRGWDKYDVDEALDDVDNTHVLTENDDNVSLEEERRFAEQQQKQMAAFEKERGNEFLKAGNFSKAAECFSAGMDVDSTNALLYANRALCFIKLKKFSEAILDCDRCITLDPGYVKAYQRRASAHTCLRQLEAACADYESVLKLEPTNKHAVKEGQRLRMTIQQEQEYIARSRIKGKFFEAVDKPVHMRSRKPLVRVAIEDVGYNSDDDYISNIIIPGVTANTKIRGKPSNADPESTESKLLMREVSTKRQLNPVSRPLIEEITTRETPVATRDAELTPAVRRDKSGPNNPFPIFGNQEPPVARVATQQAPTLEVSVDKQSLVHTMSDSSSEEDWAPVVLKKPVLGS